MNTHQGALKVRMDTCAADGILTGTCGQEHIFFTEHIFFQPKTQATTPDRKLALGSIPRLLWSEMGPPPSRAARHPCGGRPSRRCCGWCWRRCRAMPRGPVRRCTFDELPALAATSLGRLIPLKRNCIMEQESFACFCAWFHVEWL